MENKLQQFRTPKKSPKNKRDGEEKNGPNKGVALVFEDADLLDLAVRAENLLEGLLRRALRQIAAVDGAVGGR